MNEKDTLSLLHTKRERMAQMVAEQTRNNIFKKNREQFPRNKTIQQIQRMLNDPNNFADGFQFLLNLLGDDDDEIDSGVSFPFMLYYWGVLEDLVEILRNLQKLTEQQLIDLTKLIAFIVQSKEASHCFINQKGPHIIEMLLAKHNSLLVIENCLLIIGNLENYEINEYFRFVVIPRLLEFLTPQQPQSTTCLVNLSWMIKNRKFPQQEALQQQLILLKNEDVTFEALQHVEILDVDTDFMRYLVSKVDLVGDPHQIQTKLLLNFICANLTETNAINEIHDLLNKCLNSGKMMNWQATFNLAQNYMIQSKKPYYNEFVDKRLVQFLEIFDADKKNTYYGVLTSMMRYLETFHIQFPDSRFSVRFYERLMDTLSLNHLRLVSILLMQHEEFIKTISNVGIHKKKLMEMSNNSKEARELLMKIYL